MLGGAQCVELRTTASKAIRLDLSLIQSEVVPYLVKCSLAHRVLVRDGFLSGKVWEPTDEDSDEPSALHILTKKIFIIVSRWSDDIFEGQLRRLRAQWFRKVVQ